MGYFCGSLRSATSSRTDAPVTGDYEVERVKFTSDEDATRILQIATFHHQEAHESEGFIGQTLFPRPR